MTARPELVRPKATPKFSLVLETPPGEPEATRLHYYRKLEYETDPSDVNTDIEKGISEFVIVDSRGRESFDESHVAGAISIPYRTISPETTSALSKGKLIVIYCWGPGCNAATKASVRLAALGFRVKEMIGGIEYWKREGYPVEGRSKVSSEKTA